jgi:small-conductance mechanosensitive channel
MDLQSFLEYQFFQVGGYRLTVSMLIGLALIVVIAWGLTWGLGRLLDRGLQRVRWDRGRRQSVHLILQYLIWIVAVTAMLQVIGVQISVLIAGSAALLVGLGLGVQQIFRDIVSGFFLLFEGTVEVGDLLLLDNVVGRVEAISLRTSTIVTRDGIVLIVPNSRFITETVTNWSFSNRIDAAARFAVTITAPAEADERKAREVLLACAQDHPDVVHDDPKFAPSVRLRDFVNDRLQFELLFWTHRKFEVETVRSDLRFAMREAFRANGIPIAPGPTVVRLDVPATSVADPGMEKE